MNTQVRRVLGLVSGPGSNRLGLQAMRVAIAVIFLWIGALKFVPYEADSITPFVANSPVMAFFYAHPDQYAQHLTHEGELNLAARAWQTANHTYAFSRGLGTVELLIGLLVLVGLASRRLGLAGVHVHVHDRAGLGCELRRLPGRTPARVRVAALIRERIQIPLARRGISDLRASDPPSAG